MLMIIIFIEFNFPDPLLLLNNGYGTCFREKHRVEAFIDTYSERHNFSSAHLLTVVLYLCFDYGSGWDTVYYLNKLGYH